MYWILIVIVIVIFALWWFNSYEKYEAAPERGTIATRGGYPGDEDVKARRKFQWKYRRRNRRKKRRRN